MILITGPNSMMGRSLINTLTRNNVKYYSAPHDFYNLESYNECMWAFEQCNPETVFHLAGYNGNIDFNIKYPTDIFYKTAQMGLNVLRCAEKFNCKRVISVLSSCAYPDMSGEMDESQLWMGECNETVDCHGYAKRTIDAYGIQLNKKGIKHTSVIVQNSYGPYDSLNLDKTKVVTALIKRFLIAKESNTDVVCWGDGSPKREFIYCDDVGEAIYKVYTKFDGPRINIGSGEEVTIKELAEKISKIVGFTGNIIWNTEKPNGQNQKKLKLDLMKNLDIKITSLEEGLKETISWVESQL